METTEHPSTHSNKIIQAKSTTKSTKIILILLAISLLINICLICQTTNKNAIPIIDAELDGSQSFSLIDPNVAELDMKEFLENKEGYISSYTPLKTEIEKILANSTGYYGVYFEELHSHAWLGINERKKYKPASLLKTTTVASILSLVEENKLSLDKEVTLTEDDINYQFGTLYQEKGSKISIKKLIENSLLHSDNTAIKTLHQFITDEKWIETRLAMGLPLVSIEESEKGTELTRKEFSRIFHSLYYSGYLSRASSNWMLSLLSQTEFHEGIPAGVPKNIKVAHKIGIWAAEGDVHDCGIVYANKPYILCIMSSGVTQEQGDKTIKEISSKVYKYVSTR